MSREDYLSKPFYKRSPYFELLLLLLCITIGAGLYWLGMPAPGKCKAGYTTVVKDSYKLQGFAYGYGRTHTIELKECVK